jgi:hypothetical protein
MSGSPLDPLVQLMTHLAITIGGMALATLSIVAFVRWLGLHWSWALSGVPTSTMSTRRPWTHISRHSPSATPRAHVRARAGT